jgi:hypothetical protein
MTFSTASSAASASGSKSEENSGGQFLGMDEAGYGPNIGPLLITLTHWRTPAAPQRCQFYRLLKEVAAADGHAEWRKLHLADSKVVFSGKDAFASLETSALALFLCLGWDISSFQQVWKQFLGNEAVIVADGHPPLPPWYLGNLSLPVAANLDRVHQLAERLRNRMDRCGIELLQIRGDFVIEERFNRLVGTDDSNKALVLSRLAFRLLRELWSPDHPDNILFVGDKHGGRNRYDGLLAEVLDGHMIFRIEEGQQRSRYRVGATELRFEVGGERHLPVACASIVSKYLRELAMDLINKFWATHCPDVKPTRGYPGDARRFREAIDPARLQLAIDDHVFWRSR